MLIYTGNLSVKKIVDYIYASATVSLDRKRLKTFYIPKPKELISEELIEVVRSIEGLSVKKIEQITGVNSVYVWAIRKGLARRTRYAS